MIRCSHCGKLAPTGALSCQNCGMPLVSGGGAISGAGQSEEALPAWLESLRAHERPALNGQENRQPFSPDELVDENSMPSWMRQDRHRLPENGNSDSFPALPAMPGSGQEKQNAPTSGFQAGSLIDERSLPTWMRDSQGGAQAATGQSVQAHSLVDQQSLPSWIKDLGQGGPSQTTGAQYYGLTAQPQTPPASNVYGLSAQPATPSMNQYGLPGQAPVAPPSARVPQTPATQEPPPQGFSAHDLLDMQSMPNWMSGSQGPGAPPPTRPVPIGQGFSAGELVDQRSVPSWMKDLQGQEKKDPRSAMGVPVSGGSGQTMGTGQGTTGSQGMPAGSLLDANSMPAWMQNSAQNPAAEVPTSGQRLSAGSLLDASSMPGWMQNSAQNSAAEVPTSGQGMSAGSLLDMNAMPSWMREGQQGNPQASQPGAAGMSAGSLIDMGSMPAWLRNADASQSGPNTSGRLGQVQARSVPSRPRNEIMPPEQSEAAANAFASMLGVAASTPTLPVQDYGQANNLGVAQGAGLPPLQPVQPSIPGWQQPPQAPPVLNQYNQAAAPHTWQMSGPIPSISQTPTANMGQPMGQSPVMSGMVPPGNNAEAVSPAWTAFASADRPAWGANAGIGGSGNATPGGTQTQTAETKKKGFFDSIRDFFFK